MDIDETLIKEILEPTSQLVHRNRYHLTVKMNDLDLSTPARGEMLLNAEIKLRAQVDPRIEVFLEPKGDINKLRLKLRGVKV